MFDCSKLNEKLAKIITECVRDYMLEENIKLEEEALTDMVEDGCTEIYYSLAPYFYNKKSDNE